MIGVHRESARGNLWRRAGEQGDCATQRHNTRKTRPECRIAESFAQLLYLKTLFHVGGLNDMHCVESWSFRMNSREVDCGLGRMSIQELEEAGAASR